MTILNENTGLKTLNNVSVGENVKIFSFVNAYNCSIDDNSKIGTFVEIQKGATIGKSCKISSHSFICEGVLLQPMSCTNGHSYCRDCITARMEKPECQIIESMLSRNQQAEMVIKPDCKAKLVFLV